MNDPKRWRVDFHLTVIASDDFEAIFKARDKVAKDCAVAYVECYGPATEEDIEYDKAD